MKLGKVVVIIEGKTDMTLKEVRELFKDYEVELSGEEGFKSFKTHQVKVQRVEENK